MGREAAGELHGHTKISSFGPKEDTCDKFEI